MLKSNEIKFIKSLYLKKNRDEKSLFIVEGEKILSELINSDFIIDRVYATEACYDLYSSKIKEEKLFKITQKELSRISNFKSPNNVLAIVKKKNIELDYDKIQGLILVLDNINDPGNFGTIVRSCNWFNIKSIICSDNTVDLYNSKVIQSSMGSLFRVDVFYTNLKEKTKSIVNAAGSIFLGISTCLAILFVGLNGKQSIINSPILNFEITQTGSVGMFVKYQLAAFLAVFAISMLVQFVSYYFSNWDPKNHLLKLY